MDTCAKSEIETSTGVWSLEAVASKTITGDFLVSASTGNLRAPPLSEKDLNIFFRYGVHTLCLPSYRIPALCQ